MPRENAVRGTRSRGQPRSADPASGGVVSRLREDGTASRVEVAVQNGRGGRKAFLTASPCRYGEADPCWANGVWQFLHGAFEEGEESAPPNVDARPPGERSRRALLRGAGMDIPGAVIARTLAAVWAAAPLRGVRDRGRRAACARGGPSVRGGVGERARGGVRMP